MSVLKLHTQNSLTLDYFQSKVYPELSHLQSFESLLILCSTHKDKNPQTNKQKLQSTSKHSYMDKMSLSSLFNILMHSQTKKTEKQT